MFVDHRDGAVYFSTSERDIFTYSPDLKSLNRVGGGIDLRIDHGPVFYSDGTRPTYVNLIAIRPYGNVYTLARFGQNGKIIEDLVKIPDPFAD